MAMMKPTKKAIYGFFGIEYSNEKILSPIGWIKPLIKDGNDKTGKKACTFSLPAGTNGTCICDCKDCYAKTGRYTTKIVIESMQRNQYLVENYIEWTEKAILAQIIADRITMVRIHASGDFHTANPNEYAAMWRDIVIKNPSVKFWTYTKIREFESLFDDCPNANIVPSILPYSNNLNYGTCEEILKAYRLMLKHGIKPHICRCGIDENQHCETCTGCSDNKYVLFILHSSKEYNAKKDPLLPVVADIIEKQ